MVEVGQATGGRWMIVPAGGVSNEDRSGGEREGSEPKNLEGRLIAKYGEEFKNLEQRKDK